MEYRKSPRATDGLMDLAHASLACHLPPAVGWQEKEEEGVYYYFTGLAREGRLIMPALCLRRRVHTSHRCSEHLRLSPHADKPHAVPGTKLREGAMGAHALVVLRDLGSIGQCLVTDEIMRLTPKCLSSNARLGFVLQGLRALADKGRLVFRKC